MTIKEKIIAEIRSYIGFETQDTLLNHFKTFYKNDKRFYGTFTPTGFKIWRCSRFLTGLCYPVAIATFDDSSKKLLVNKKTKLNSAGILFTVFFLLCIGIGGFLMIKGDDSFFEFLKKDIFLWIFYMAPFSFLLLYLNSFFSKEFLNQVEGMIRDAEKN
jgi:hypothetical protein